MVDRFSECDIERVCDVLRPDFLQDAQFLKDSPNICVRSSEDDPGVAFPGKVVTRRGLLPAWWRHVGRVSGPCDVSGVVKRIDSEGVDVSGSDEVQDP